MNFAKKIQRRNMRRAGLTLIELVMVLVILTALAALVVPQVDYLRRTSDKATASFVMEQVVENIGMFRSIKGDYPKKLDALLSGDGTADATDSTGIALSSKITSKRGKQNAKTPDAQCHESMFNMRMVTREDW